jgi:phosphate transport system permease protein
MSAPTRSPESSVSRELVHPSLPGGLPPALMAGSVGVVAVLLLVATDVGTGVVAVLAPFLGMLAFTALIFLLAFGVEGRRRAVDRFVQGLVLTAFLAALAPLLSVAFTVLQNGIARFDLEFLTSDMRNVLGEGGGVSHAIVGTLLVTLITAVISIPVGIMCAIYLVEYGKGPLKRWVTFLVDVMTGIPSIVAGLFSFALFAVLVGSGYRSGFAGAIALTVLMLPTVIRSAEEMLKLVPNELREASYALGVPRYRTILKVVLPTALAGIVTGVVLAIARVIGETAPLLLTAGFTATLNLNPFEGRMTTLPVFSYYSYVTPGVPPEFGYDRAWSAALVLIIIVMTLNLFARLVSWKFSPKGER